MQSYFLQLFGYDKWATTRLLEVFDQKPANNPRIIELLSHMQSTQCIWLDRCLGRKETVQRFQPRTREEIGNALQAYHSDWVAYIQSLQPEDLNKQISYTNFQGDAFTNTLSDIITQVTNHGTHHRGNIIILMKEEGYPPPNLDYISYVRIIPRPSSNLNTVYFKIATGYKNTVTGSLLRFGPADDGYRFSWDEANKTGTYRFFTNNDAIYLELIYNYAREETYTCTLLEIINDIPQKFNLQDRYKRVYTFEKI